MKLDQKQAWKRFLKEFLVVEKNDDILSNTTLIEYKKIDFSAYF